ncbi:ATP-binding cassette domain-containing protein [Thermocatellispora tengchongensis]
MIGTEATGSHYHDDLHTPPERESVRLSVRGLCGDGFSDVSFDLARGEVVAVAGVHGSGREELCRALFGGRAITAGQVELDGETVRLSSPRDAVRAGLGYVPSERKVEGIVAAMSVAENMALPHTGALAREAQAVEEWIERLRIKTPDRHTAIGTLSGGNQQKVVLARWLLTGSLRVLLLDHPTRGLDVGAKSEVYRLIRDLSASGVSVLMLADSLEECIAMSDRVLVMKEGRVTMTLHTPPGAKPDPVELVKEMV